MNNKNNYYNNWICSARLDMEDTNPEWKIEKSKTKKLLNIWNNLKTVVEIPKSKSVYLGYKGTSIKTNDTTEWFTFGNVVTFRKNNQIETRYDGNRKFEMELLKSAPTGKIPDAFFALEFGFN